MAENTPNYNLEKQAGNDNVNIEGINNNFDIIDTEIKKAQDKADQAFQSASNGKIIIADAITGKGIPTSANDTFSTMANNIEAIETDPSVGTTDATAADILSGKKAVSQGELKTGTMPDRGPAAAETINLTSQNQEYTIVLGFHTGLRKIKAVISGLAASAIAMGATVGGITGTFTGDATATAAQMLSGVIAYIKGVKVTGTIPSKGAATITPGTTNQTIAANQFLSGIQTILGSANLLAENIKKGVNIFGKIGTLEPFVDSALKAKAVRSSSLGILITETESHANFSSSNPFTTYLTLFTVINYTNGGAGSLVLTCPKDFYYVDYQSSNIITKVTSGTVTIPTSSYSQDQLLVYNPTKAPITFSIINYSYSRTVDLGKILE